MDIAPAGVRRPLDRGLNRRERIVLAAEVGIVAERARNKEVRVCLSGCIADALPAAVSRHGWATCAKGQENRSRHPPPRAPGRRSVHWIIHKDISQAASGRNSK